MVVLPYHSGSQKVKKGSTKEAVDSSMDRFAPQIWDVRKGWIAKWSVSAGDGPATGETMFTVSR
jgi:hypothetical protein